MIKGFKGFTLVEMMVTVAIIAIVGGSILVAINSRGQVNRATDATLRKNIKEVATAMESCYARSSDWTACDSLADLATAGFIRTSSVTGVAVGADSSGTVCAAAGPCCVYGDDPVTTGNKIRYSSTSGSLTSLAAASSNCN